MQISLQTGKTGSHPRQIFNERMAKRKVRLCLRLDPNMCECRRQNFLQTTINLLEALRKPSSKAYSHWTVRASRITKILVPYSEHRA